MSEQQPEKQAEKPQDKLMIEVVLTADKQISYKIMSSHIPMLTYALKLLEVEVQKMIINQGLRKLQSAPEGIIIPGNGKKHNIINFLRGQKN